MSLGSPHTHPDEPTIDEYTGPVACTKSHDEVDDELHSKSCPLQRTVTEVDTVLQRLGTPSGMFGYEYPQPYTCGEGA